MTSVSESADSAHTKKPSDSAFKQQKLPAWQPILTAGTVLPTFFVIGIAFIPVGIGLLYFSDEVKEHIIDYTNCMETKPNGTNAWYETNQTCVDWLKANPNITSDTCYCRIKFSLKEDFQNRVFMYYGLTNFYQNHRRYVKSRDDNQLLGNLGSTPAHECMPFDYSTDANTNVKKPIAPCGAIANSMFNDLLTLSVMSGNEYKAVTLLNTGIAWESDKNIKFRNPPGENLTKAFEGFARPKAWKKDIWALDLDNPENNGFQNEDLIVWMRTAALPTFRKLYRRIERTLDKGDYLLTVEYNYNVSTFDGSKQMILSTTSLLGGKNPFLGIAYIVVGVICLVLGIALLLIHIKCGKSTSEMINVNPRTPYQ